MVIQSYTMSQSQQPLSQMSQRAGSAARKDDRPVPPLSQPTYEVSIRRDPSVRHVEKDNSVRVSRKLCSVSDDDLTPRTPRRPDFVREFAWFCERW